jgi:hypothetical protein
MSMTTVKLFVWSRGAENELYDDDEDGFAEDETDDEGLRDEADGEHEA